MNTLIGVSVGVLIVYACVITALAIVFNERIVNEKDRHETELAAYKKVGRWYEERVQALEYETTQLAGQVLATTGHPAVAMPYEPLPPPKLYAFDQTGLVVEELDDRDLPVS